MSKFHIPETTIYICTGSKCSKRGAKEFYKEMKSTLKRSGVKDEIELIKTECTDRCKYAPVLSIQPENVWLKEYSGREVLQLLEEIIKKKNI